MNDPFDFDINAIVNRLVGKPADEIVAAFEALVRSPTYCADGPKLLHQLWQQRRLSVEVLRRVLLGVWRNADSPLADCPASAWRAMFGTTGFISDGASKPTRTKVLYRGCTTP